ncbi:hypothetical protein [Poriferisphaera sp. WC338]|uniref:hypothetical protein n=1 Tax=Poriferisphaera sp. WC338 TaxID=3425129 RepID=UPI003D81733F
MQKHDEIRQYLCSQLAEIPQGGGKLDSEWVIAKRFGVSRQVARRELQRLVREGRAEVRRGVGYVGRRITRSSRGPLHIAIIHSKQDRITRTSQTVILRKLVVALERNHIRSSMLEIDEREQMLWSGYQKFDAYILYSVAIGVQSFFAGKSKPAVVLGNTYHDLNMPCVCLNELEVAARITTAMLDDGHRRLGLVQAHRYNLGLERCRLGFEYAYHSKYYRLSRDQMIRVSVVQRGFRSSLHALLQAELSGLIIQNAALWAALLRTANTAQRKKLSQMEVVLLGQNTIDELDDPKPVVTFDTDAIVDQIVQILDKCLRGLPIDLRFVEAPWTIEVPAGTATPRWLEVDVLEDC